MTTEQANKRITGDLRDVALSAGESLGETAGKAGEAVSALRSRMAKAIEAASATCERLEAATKAAAKATDSCVRDHPWETIGVAVGLGLLIGVLMRRR